MTRIDTTTIKATYKNLNLDDSQKLTADDVCDILDTIKAGDLHKAIDLIRALYERAYVMGYASGKVDAEILNGTVTDDLAKYFGDMCATPEVVGEMAGIDPDHLENVLDDAEPWTPEDVIRLSAQTSISMKNLTLRHELED